jgi:hypothetical protein
MSLGFTDAFEAQIAIDNADLNLAYQEFTDTIRAQGEEVKMLRKELGLVRKESVALEGFALVPPRELKF